MGDLQIHGNQGAVAVADSFNALVADIYDSTTRANGFEPFLKKLCEYTNSATANMSTVNVADGCFIGGWLHGFRQEDIAFYVEHNLIEQDPLAQRVMHSGPGPFVVTRQTIDWEELKGREIYHQWMAPQDMIDAAGSMIGSEGNVLTTLFVQRNSRQGEFGESQLELLNSLIPHLQRAVSLYMRLLEKNVHHQPLTAALDAMATPTILLDARGMVSFANRSAREFVEERDWIGVDDGVLTITDSGLRNKFLRLLVDNTSYAFSGKVDDKSIVHFEVDGERVAFLMQPVDASRGSDAHGGAILFIHRHRQNIDETKVPMVAELFHLSPAEGQVALLLSQGLSVVAIADYTGRKENTVRMQLKSAFAKTGVNTQGQLVSLILTSPVFLS